MNAKSYAVLFFILLFTVCPGSTVLAGGQKTVFATFRTCVYWVHKADFKAAWRGRLRNPDSAPALGLGNRGRDGQEKKTRKLLHI